MIDQKSIKWNSSGDRVAFAAGASFLMETYLLSIDAGKYTLNKLPGPQLGWDNFHQTPKQWKGSLLTLNVNGPYAGKADGYRYSGVMTVSVSDVPFKVVSEDINTVEQGAAANP